MKGTIFIVGPLHEIRPQLVAALEPFVYVCAFSTAAEMEKELRERLLPELVILSATGVQADDLPLFTLVEQYWAGGAVDLILILPVRIEETEAPMFYGPYGKRCFVQPVKIEEIVAAAREIMRTKTLR